MFPKKPLALPAPASREVALHLWPGGEVSRPVDWPALQSVLMRRRALLLLTFFGVLFLLLLATWLRPPVYNSTATLQVNTSSPYTSENELPVLSDITGMNQSRSIVTQTEILQSDSVRERALSLLAPNDRQAVGAGSVAVKSIPETDLINVAGTSRDPHAAAAYANALCTAYIMFSREKNRSQYSTARQYVGVQLQAARARLEEARNEVRRYKQRNGTVNLTAETDNQINELNRIQSEARQAQAAQEAALAQIKRLQAEVASLKPTVVASSTIATRPEVVSTQARLTELELQRIAALEEFQANAPEVRRIETEIASVRARLRTQSKTEVQSQQEAPNPARQEALLTISRLQGEVSSQAARGRALKALATRIQGNLSRLPAREAQIGQLNTDLSGLQQSYETLNQKYQTLRASEASRVASGSLIFPAKVPGQPVRPLTPLRLFICLALAALLTLAVTTLAEGLDHRMRSSHDVPAISNVSMLAQIPLVRNVGEQCLINSKAMVSPLVENFRTLRTMLSLSAHADGHPAPRVLAVTSSVPKEGKSLVAVNLAVAAALSGEQVILVDCDLRWPELHHLCGNSNEVGFINVVNGDATLRDALQDTRIPGLYILTSGPRSSNPFRILNSPVGREVLQQLGELADLVIVDTPPVQVLADARITAALADSVLLVVSTEEPTKADVVQSVDLLEQSGANIAGMVLNKVVPAPGSGYRDYQSLYPPYNPNDDSLTPAANDYDFNGGPVRNGNGPSSNGSAPMIPAEPARDGRV